MDHLDSVEFLDITIYNESRFRENSIQFLVKELRLRGSNLDKGSKRVEFDRGK